MRWLFVVLCSGILAACGPAVSGIPDLPEGDPVNGEVLFSQSVGGAPSCSGCHLLDADAAAAGPHVVNYAETAAQRVADEDAYTYTYYSIVQPARYTVPGYANIMYGQYRQSLDEQELADLIAYLLTLNGEA